MIVKSIGMTLNYLIRVFKLIYRHAVSTAA